MNAGDCYLVKQGKLARSMPLHAVLLNDGISLLSEQDHQDKKQNNRF